ncbi:MAG: RHS repeat-associated core domain-containing protein [Bacillota bacterium]|nr:RHS repeat-associated core domain-containing protein [Bacillota bacterium]
MTVNGFANLSYDAAGNLTQLAYTNGRTTNYTYNNRGLLSRILSPVLDLQYAYDNVGNITGINNEVYSYDGLNRLHTANKPGHNYLVGYQYDAVGNRTQQVEDGITTIYTYSPVNALTTSTGATYTWDARGNLVGKVQGADTWSYTFDLGNMLTQVTKNGITLGTYAYDANGIRAKKVERGATTHYLAMGHQVMYEKTGAEATRHIFAGNQRIAEVKGGVTSYFHNDHLGSPRVVTDAAGAVTAQVATKPFGEPHAGSDPTSYGFTGKDLDDTGLYYFAARYYDASVGRFVSPDTHWNHNNMIYGDDPDNKSPLIAAITQSTNLYVYCANNPLIYVDPDGEFFFVATGILGALIGGVGGAIHSYVNHGEVRWQSVATGAAIGGAIGLTGGAATAFFAAGSATATTGTALVKLGLVAKAGGTIILGESMGRVNNAAQKYGAEVYKGLNGYKAIEDTFGTGIAKAIGALDNASWLLNKMLLDYRVIDIGIDPSRATRSFNYAMEQWFLKFHQFKEFIPFP